MKPEPTTLSSLPNDLDALQKATGYREWESITVFSRSLKHYRQLRIGGGWNIVVSETGKDAGQVDVVEVVLLPLEPDDLAEFAIYEPKTGARLERYPADVTFEVEGIVGGSRTSVPALCIACHSEKKPLNAVIPWSNSLQSDIDRVRQKGVGIRQMLVDPLPDDEHTAKKIDQFNKSMESRFPGQYTDLRQWIKPYIE